MNEPDLPDTPDRQLRIAVVGPCSAGKSLLGNALKQAGYTVRQPAQEHSLVPDMWQRLSRPDLLIYLDVDYAVARRRRPHHDGGPERVATQNERLKHARAHCDLYVDTRTASPAEIQAEVFAFLASLQGGNI